MSQKKSKATRRSISVLKQIVSGILPGWKIEGAKSYLCKESRF